MKKYLYLLILLCGTVLLQPNCNKIKHCEIETTVPIFFSIDKMELLRSVEMAFYDGDRPVEAEILYPQFFVQGTFKWEYKFYDLKSDHLTVVRRLYSHDGSWIEYETKIPLR